MFLVIAITGCNGCKKNVQNPNEHKVIYKIHKKTGSQDKDTLWVSQNDSLVFKSEEEMQGNPGQKAKWVTRYELRHPKNDAYYFIYNDMKQLIQEGIYTAQYTTSEGEIIEGNFYNSKSYYYKNNGKLRSIHYQVDGRNFKTELFNRKRELTEIIYFNKKSGDREKVEIYKNGKLKETRIYTAFDVYHTVEAGE